MEPRPHVPARPELVEFTDRPYRHRLALHGVGIDEWLDVDDALGWDLARRRERIATEPDRVVVRLPGEDRPEHLLAATVAEALAGVGGSPGGTLGDGGVDPLVAVGTATQEDWCLLRKDGPSWRFVAGVVCFPTAWEATEKLGLAVGAIHDPVPEYAEQIGGAVDRSLDRLDGDTVRWRRNWSLVTTPDLWLPPDAPVGRVGDVGADVWLRVERQTFRRLAEDVIVFGIRIHRWPLAEAAAVADLTGLATAIETMSPGFRAYKELLATHGDVVARWVASNPARPS